MNIEMPMGIHTTYDFSSKTFGHASTLVGPFESLADPALLELQRARERLVLEIVKKRKGRPYDKRFVGEERA